MALSRKRRRELRKLRSHTQDLLEEQRVVLDHAGEVLQKAGKQAKLLSDEHLLPRVESAASTVRPVVDRGVESARRAGERIGKVTTPIVAAALAKSVQTLEQLENEEAAKQLRRFSERKGLLKKKKRKVGGVIATVLGLAAALGVGYALWQSFRTDDELWVAPEH